ncbi:large ribosomal subunit protein mL48 isoform X2 [Eucyclogobius newberryi]|uniref:large ribosomal subunit protein mL48 isoform X2 n=1 Tax=Eucyclogobius newberryi TaxID=166745 RepID=UPI003B598A9E
MNPVFRKVQTVLTQALVSDQAASICRVSPLAQQLVFGTVAVSHRQYRGMPTHEIGKWKHFLPREAPKKKKDKLQMKQIVAPTQTAFGTLNVTVSGFDMTLVEHYSQYIHNLCNRLGIKVAESYALPTKTTEVSVLQDQGTKMLVDAVLKTHERIVQVSSLNASLCPVLLDILLKNQPEGVQLSVREHSEADFQARFKARPELEGLMAQVGH